MNTHIMPGYKTSWIFWLCCIRHVRLKGVRHQYSESHQTMTQTMSENLSLKSFTLKSRGLREWKAYDVGPGKPCIYQSFSMYRYTHVGKHLTVYKVRERNVLQYNSIMRKWVEVPNILYWSWSTCAEILRSRMGLKTSLRGSCIPEKLNVTEHY